MKELTFCTTYNVVYGDRVFKEVDQEKMNMFLKAVFPDLQLAKNNYAADYLWLNKKELKKVIEIIEDTPVWMDEMIGNFNLPYITENLYQIFLKWYNESDKNHDYVYIEWI